VVVELGATIVLPLVPTAPMPGLMLTDVAFDELQLNVALAPEATLAGCTLKLTLGAADGVGSVECVAWQPARQNPTTTFKAKLLNLLIQSPQDAKLLLGKAASFTGLSQ
jgi:hypothetical protein